jgi:hypothetical protein
MIDEPTPAHQLETVTYCLICRTKTWHVDGVCEWSDGHGLRTLDPNKAPEGQAHGER